MSQVDQIERLQNMNSLVRSITKTEPIVAREINRQLQEIREKMDQNTISRAKILEWADSIFTFYRSHTSNWEFHFSIADQSTGYSPLWVQNELSSWLKKHSSARTVMIVLFGMKEPSKKNRPENTPNFETDRAYLENYLSHQVSQKTQVLLLIV